MKSKIIEELLLDIAEPCHIKRLSKVVKWIDRWAYELNLVEKKEDSCAIIKEHISKVLSKSRNKS